MFRIKEYALPPFSLIDRESIKASINAWEMPVWKTQPWCSHLLRLSIRNPIILPKTPHLLEGPNNSSFDLLKKRNFQLWAWTVSRKSYLQEKYQGNLPLSSQMSIAHMQYLITYWSKVEEIVCVVDDKNNLVICPWNFILHSLTQW